MKPSSEYSRVGNWLYKCRRSTNPILGQEEVANTAGVCRNTYRKWELGQGGPDPIHLKRLQEKYGWKYLPNC